MKNVKRLEDPRKIGERQRPDERLLGDVVHANLSDQPVLAVGDLQERFEDGIENMSFTPCGAMALSVHHGSKHEICREIDIIQGNRPHIVSARDRRSILIRRG